ncbi:hypothetical protein Q4584_10620 [Cellulophaga sp. 1_MG-2023]|nr:MULTISPECIES: hypothetical protein [Cellulophaga]MDO6768285.1 hypothetical protein [Cellulophaga sp. 1_MG-2023]
MFSKGQLIFGILFFIVFTIITFFTYRKDINLHRKNYKGVIWIVATFILFIITLFVIKELLKN